MDGNMAEMLKGVLSDPSAMEKLMGVAQGLMGSMDKGGESGASEIPQNDGRDEEGAAIRTHIHDKRPGNDERIALISALLPYLSEERRQTADSLVKMLKMLKVADINKILRG